MNTPTLGHDCICHALPAVQKLKLPLFCNTSNICLTWPLQLHWVGCALTWCCSKSKKQSVQSSAEAKYLSMHLATCVFVWIKQLLQELKFCENEQMKLYRDN